MKTKNKISILLGLAAILLSVVIGLFQRNPEIYVAILFNCGIVLIVIGMVRQWKYGKGIEHDERTLQQIYLSQTIAFQLSLIVLTFIWVFNYFIPLGISLSSFLLTLILTMAFLSVLVNFIIERKAKK